MKSDNSISECLSINSIKDGKVFHSQLSVERSESDKKSNLPCNENVFQVSEMSTGLLRERQDHSDSYCNVYGYMSMTRHRPTIITQPCRHGHDINLIRSFSKLELIPSQNPCTGLAIPVNCCRIQQIVMKSTIDSLKLSFCWTYLPNVAP